MLLADGSFADRFRDCWNVIILANRFAGSRYALSSQLKDASLREALEAVLDDEGQGCQPYDITKPKNFFCITLSLTLETLWTW